VIPRRPRPQSTRCESTSMSQRILPKKLFRMMWWVAVWGGGGVWGAGCVETSDCRINGDCGVNQSCHRGYCHDVCKTTVEGSNGEQEDLSLRCSDPTRQRCVCVQTLDGNTCSDEAEQVCNPTLDNYCLCFDENADCEPRCKTPQEACVRGACVRQAD
jgi:hypothetical protein